MQLETACASDSMRPEYGLGASVEQSETAKSLSDTLFWASAPRATVGSSLAASSRCGYHHRANFLSAIAAQNHAIPASDDTFNTTTTSPQAAIVFDLSGRTALVTGSTQGIGLEMARAISSAGANVIVHGHRDDDAAR